MRDMFSLIQWEQDILKAPIGDNLLVIYKDDSGDHTNYYTTVAWKTFDDNHWISDNEEILYDIIAWSRLPEYEKIKIF